MSTITADFLDNPAWHALSGAHADLARVAGGARQYPAEVSMWGAMDAPAWDDMAELVAPGGVVALMRRTAAVPGEGWHVVVREPATQMVLAEHAALDTAAPSGVVELGPDDAPEMLALATLTEPGPFAIGTRRLGRYVGVRDATGALVAMAGERFRGAGWVEVSGVCTHPSARGQGLAAALSAEIARGIRAGGDRVVLHVRQGNDGARRVYERLGFVVNAPIEVLAAVRQP